MKTLVGGEIVGYTEMLNEARQIATKRMVDEAKEMQEDPESSGISVWISPGRDAGVHPGQAGGVDRAAADPGNI